MAWTDHHEVLSVALAYFTCCVILGLAIAGILNLLNCCVHVSFTRP